MAGVGTKGYGIRLLRAGRPYSSRDGSNPPIINHQKAMLPSSWRAVRTVNVQARVTDDPTVTRTVRNVELVVCSKTLVAAYRGAYGLTLAT